MKKAERIAEIEKNLREQPYLEETGAEWLLKELKATRDMLSDYRSVSIDSGEDEDNNDAVIDFLDGEA